MDVWGKLYDKAAGEQVIIAIDPAVGPGEVVLVRSNGTRETWVWDDGDWRCTGEPVTLTDLLLSPSEDEDLQANTGEGEEGPVTVADLLRPSFRPSPALQEAFLRWTEEGISIRFPRLVEFKPPGEVRARVPVLAQLDGVIARANAGLRESMSPASRAGYARTLMEIADAAGATTAEPVVIAALDDRRDILRQLAMHHLGIARGDAG